MSVRVARIGKPHGVRGEVTVELFTDDPQARFAPGSVLDVQPGRGARRGAEDEKAPAVRRTCTEAALRDYLGPGVDGEFSIYVLPTDQYAFIDGSRSFQCLASYQELEPIKGSLHDGP